MSLISKTHFGLFKKQKRTWISNQVLFGINALGDPTKAEQA
jgi:hypothetical protein